MHRLFDQGLVHDWAIIGGGIKLYDAVMRAKLLPQDWLTTIIELDPEGRSAAITGVMIDFADAQAAALISAHMRPEIRIVSLTITEGGYFEIPLSFIILPDASISSLLNSSRGEMLQEVRCIFGTQ